MQKNEKALRFLKVISTSHRNFVILEKKRFYVPVQATTAEGLKLCSIVVGRYVKLSLSLDIFAP